MIRTCIALLLAALPAAAHTISGTVVGPDGPVAGATVEFRYESNPGVAGYVTTSNFEGRFSGPAPEEILFLRATAPPERELSVFDDGIGLKITRDYTVRIRLVRLVRISGDIRNAAGQRVAGTVSLYSLTSATQNNDHSRQGPVAEMETSDGTFLFETAGDFYSIHARVAGQTVASGRVNVDARANVHSVRVVLSERAGHLMPRAAARSDRISVSAPDGDFALTIEGAPGATEPLSAVRVINMMTGQATGTVSRADGGFSVRTYGAPGATLALYHDPTGWYLPVAPNNATGVPAVFLQVPSSDPTIAVASSLIAGLLEQSTQTTIDTFGALDDGQWIVSSAWTDREWAAGETVSMAGTLTILSRNLGSDVAAISANGHLSLIPRFDAEGRQRTPDKVFASTDLTPSGFPIERKTRALSLGQLNVTNLRSVSAGRAAADWSLVFTLPPQIPAGIYQPMVRMSIQGIPSDGRFLDAPVSVGGSVFTDNAFWPLVTIGAPQPPRLFFALAMNDFDNGVRGTIAREDRGAYQISNHVALQPDLFVVASRDERTGAPVLHRLEPFLPLLSGVDALRAASPIPFVPSSGSLRVRVHRPDGVIDDLGSAPFLQMESRFPLTRGDLRIALGTAQFPAINELTTLDPRFEYHFAQQGKYLVEMGGTIRDAWGRTYEGGGSYEVIAGRTLDIDGGVIVGTPFEDGDVFAASAVLTPPVPAEIEFRIRRFSPSGEIEETRVRTLANRFGYAAAEGIALKGEGEFRVDVRATHVGEDGTFWAGEVSWGSVVASPPGVIVTRGRQGFQEAPHVGQHWFRFTDDGQQPGDHVMFPFSSGDVMWMEDSDRFSGLADSPAASLQDLTGAFAPRVRERFHRFQPVLGSPVPFAEREAASELPLFSSGEQTMLDWGPPEQWGYGYFYAVRPSIRVREMVTEDYTPAAYWRFRDNYHFQPGNGINGDLPNDFKFQFSGTVWRDETDGFRHYGAYASLFVLIPERDPAQGRIMPPFRGNGGGPDGGALFTLKGEEIDLFFHPTAVRPGTIVHRGERVSFAGYSAPTLPSRVEIVVTAPSGRTRIIRGHANSVGYFHDPTQDFTADQSGVWTAKARIVFDGQTSAGQVTEPYPSGDVLGSRAGEFFFYVVDANTPRLEIGSMPRFLRPADGPITFSIVPPPGLSDLRLTYTIAMPGFILEEGTKTAMTVTYDAPNLARDFPNLDLHDADGHAGMDPITISFLVSGTDSGSVRRHFARQIVIQGEELQTPEQHPRPKRRAARK